jgi:hypothetical protein
VPLDRTFAPDKIQFERLSVGSPTVTMVVDDWECLWYKNKGRKIEGA